jgi:hypothetical protein
MLFKFFALIDAVWRRAVVAASVTALLLAGLSGCGGSSGSQVDLGIAWQVAERIESGISGHAIHSEVVMDGDGNAVALWERFDGSNYSTFANYYSPATGWGTPEEADGYSASSAWNSDIAVDASGVYTAVWQQFENGRTHIWSRQYRFGSGWSGETLIETDDAGDANNPEVAVDPAGNAIAVWHQSDGSRKNIWSNSYSVVVGWGTAQLIETNNAGDAIDPEIAVDSNGNGVAVWSQSDGTVRSIWSSYYTPGGGWAPAQLIETTDTGNANTPRVAIDPDGTAIAVWQQLDGGGQANIWGNRFVPNTGWGTAERVQTETSQYAALPVVGMDAAGHAVAVWRQNDNIWSNSYDPASGWGSESVNIETIDGGAFTPEVAVAGNGAAVAVWKQFDGTNFNIWSNHYVKGGGWGTASVIDIADTKDAWYPAVAIGADGTAVSVWSVWGQHDGSNSAGIDDRIWAIVFK